MACPADFGSIANPIESLSVEWDFIIPTGPSRADGIIVTYTTIIDGYEVQITPRLTVLGSNLRSSHVFDQGKTTVVTVTASDLNNIFASHSCSFTVITGTVQGML